MREHKGTRIEQAGRASEQGRVGRHDSIEPGRWQHDYDCFNGRTIS